MGVDPEASGLALTRDRNRFYQLTCDYVIELPPDTTLDADAIDDVVWHALVGLLESHGGQMGGGQKTVPIDGMAEDDDEATAPQ